MVSSKKSDGGLKFCRIHDLFRDLCLSESRAEKGIQICTLTDIRSLDNVNSYRLSIRNTDWDHLSSDPYLDLTSFKSAHILDFGSDEYYVLSPRVRDLSEFIHLRYLRLNLSWLCPTEYDPDPIFTLPNIETLIFDKLFSYYNLPHRIWRLKKLRHLKGMLCMTSKTVPPDTSGSGEDCLPNLQTLKLITLEQGLTMSSIVHGRFPKLRKLGLQWNHGSKCTERELLQGLHHLKYLEKLQLVNFKELPKASEFPSNITKINIGVPKLSLSIDDEFRALDINSSFLNTLGHLSSLRVLKVSSGEVSGESLCLATGSFPNLEVLHLKEMKFRRRILEECTMPG
ncbi:hypothetical protein PIB30_054556 [Stylosanthes scabra]|uniref:Disease resistance R13L4/SHOC-2-like LRR domain-containing protein n=1 Tax=Stylosanthes scabra TaxID=79078 RepID=A0ABU6SIR8_9FABA|nr:hypothetical protein [Stylosanthes scabra]